MVTVSGWLPLNCSSSKNQRDRSPGPEQCQSVDFQTTIRLHLIQPLDKSVLLSVLISPLSIKQQATDTGKELFSRTFPFTPRYRTVSSTVSRKARRRREKGKRGERTPNEQPSPSSDSNYKRRVALTNFQHFAPRTVQQPLFLCVFVYSMPAPAGGCLPVGCRRCRCRSCPRPLRAARRGAARSGGGRRVSPTQSAAGDAAPGRPGRGAEPPSGRRGESGCRCRSPGGMCMGGSQGNPRSPPRPLPGCRAGRGADAEERSSSRALLPPPAARPSGEYEGVLK